MLFVAKAQNLIQVLAHLREPADAVETSPASVGCKARVVQLLLPKVYIFCSYDYWLAMTEPGRGTPKR
jgi:hypothetical protein